MYKTKKSKKYGKSIGKRNVEQGMLNIDFRHERSNDLAVLFVIILHSSFCIHHSAISVLQSAFCIHHSAIIILHSSFTIHHSSFIILHSSFCIHHSSFCIHHSAFSVLHSAFCIQRSAYHSLGHRSLATASVSGSTAIAMLGNFDFSLG